VTHKTENLIGRVFEKCRLIAKLGAGGMGSVYLAEHSGLNRKVAVKILPADMSRDPEYVARFRREALTAARLEHPNIVQVYDVGQYEGRPYIIMQYVDGESLSTIVENLGAMDPKDAAKVIAGMLRGLHHAHEQGIVHRDVKPDNVLVTKGDQPKLLDFGLATESEGSMQITKDGMVVGTPYYLSPEQARGKKATPLSDIYAAGISLYYLLTGVRPFTGATALAVLNKHIHDQPEAPAKKNPKVPKVLSDLVLKLMAKRPEDRYPTAGAAAQAIEDWLAGRQVRVSLPWRSRLPVLSRKQKLAAAAGGGAGFALLVTLLVIAFSGGSPAPAPAKAPPDKPPVVVAPPVDPARDADLVATLTLTTTHKDDFSAWGMVLDRFDTLLGLAKSPEILAQAQKSRDEFVAEIRRRAEAELRTARHEHPDLLDRLRALDAFPKPLLALDVLGDLRQTLREDRERVLERLDLKFLEDEAALDRLLAADDFTGASELTRKMLRIIEILPYARERRLPRVQKVRDEEIPRRERDAADRLVQSWVPVHAALEASLAKREMAAAWAHAVKFVKEHKEADVRAAGVNYDALLALVPDSQLSDARLGNALLTIGAAWGRAEDALAFRILTDLQDVLDIEWLTRQIAVGLRRLSSGGPEVRMDTFNSLGRVRLGPRGYEFALKSGTSSPINTSQLKPTDLLLLAAAAEGQSPERALEANASLARASAVAWLYSSSDEKWARAETTLARAEQMGAPGPAFRRARLREIGRAQAREAMAGALKARKYEDAERILAGLAAAWSHDPDMKVEIGRGLAVVAGAEMRRAGEARDYLRVKTLGRKLFAGDEEQYKQAGFVSLFGHALRNTGFWQTLPPDPTSDAWTWEGRDKKTPPPAAELKGTADGFLLQPDRPLLVAAAKTRGVSGYNAQFRVPGKTRTFEISLLFDLGPDGRRKRVAFREPDQVLVFEGDAKGETLSRLVPLDARITPGRWFDLGWASEGDSLVIFVDQRPHFALRGAVRPDAPVGLVTNTPAQVRTNQVQLRR
jgi:tRNA A-37 threonylcarbamoyl transferase component Bud32